MSLINLLFFFPLGKLLPFSFHDYNYLLVIFMGVFYANLPLSLYYDAGFHQNYHQSLCFKLLWCHYLRFTES